jgi:coproporphyrinogen dehydrogenase HemZ
LYSIAVEDEKSCYRLSELARMFLRPEEFSIAIGDCDSDAAYDLRIASRMDALRQAQILYDFLSAETGRSLEWGVLTGVRPVKLLQELVAAASATEAVRILTEEYRVSENKISLLMDVYRTQADVVYQPSPPSVGLYIGIPFCPSRCQYCSFPSNVYTQRGSEQYLDALHKEVDAVHVILRGKSWNAESIYIGGGTPTSLSSEQFDDLLAHVSRAFLSQDTREFTVECGRPDTIDPFKLDAILKHGGRRISINPQSMKDETLVAIGRSHSAADIGKAFEFAASAGIRDINADLIAGLPGESLSDFEESLERVLAFEPSNITVHTLAVKRASRLIEEDRDVSFRQADTASQMVALARKRLCSDGYRPYYLYRQKHMAGNMENVGYAKPGAESLYNIRIMAEDQSIIALGAGGITKMYYPAENRLERIPNVTNYEIYTERIDEMIRRKEAGII